MTERIRDRATFEALARARRVHRGPLSLRHVADPDGAGTARVAFAIGRSAGSAVRRNRIRRRLRAALGELEAGGHLPPGAYLVGAGPEALRMSYPELREAVAALVDVARRGTR